MNGSCLATREGRTIPLRGVEVNGEVLGGHATVRVRQRYRNEESRAVEAVYTFPLPSDAVLIGFSMTCDGRTIVGEVKEREEAFAAYDGAISSGHGAALLEQERPNVFTASVGNLLPNEETVIEVTYLQRVQADEGALRWMIPTLVAPRYIPGVDKGDRTGHGRENPTDQVPDADRISPPIGAVDYALSLDLLFDLGREVKVSSPSHTVDVRREEGQRVRVRFSQKEVALDRDVVLTIAPVTFTSEPLTTVTAHRTDDGEGYFAMTVVPDLGARAHKPVTQQVVFVIDTSGSMEGASIAEARAALKLCTRQLREGDRFNVIQFNNAYSTFQPEPVPFTQHTLRAVDAWIDTLVANGGTEMLSPLQAAVAMAPDGIVVLLTDGQVGNESAVLSAVIAARKSTRVYSFGIGTNVSDVLLRDLARHTSAAVEFIHPGERIDEKVVAVFARAIAPRVTDVSVRFAGVDVGETSPSEPGSLVDGEPWSMFGRYTRAAYGRAEIRGKLDGESFALDVPLGLPDRSDRPAVAKLWASERVRDLEAAMLTGRRADSMKARITKLSMDYGVMSKYTSFLVVEKRTGDRRATGQPETRVVPVNLPAGWKIPSHGAVVLGGFGASGGGARTGAAASVMKPMARMAASPLGRAAPPPMPAPGAPRAFAPPPPASPAPARMRAEASKKSDRRADVSSKDEFFGFAEAMPMLADGADTVTSLLTSQLASGLWDERGAGDEATRQVRATAKALLALRNEGIDTSHATHGSQVRKAVEALLDAIARLPPSANDLSMFALGVAWLVATGARTRARIEGALHANAAFANIAKHLGNESQMLAAVKAIAASD